ncbi:putative tail fiber protein [Ralstonia phage phiITL-1]|uniref:Putative tail fiber protein n=1 Tax=Ralstonia phage phiITL-1 TaxID=1597967 RepID=A0A0U1ZHH3_9CAUD|nr:tail fiber protein [Ralstonia phage phiITL-1]AJT60790.1 putative tail fiber protein [Ralstonia phage phiITL-1]
MAAPTTVKVYPLDDVSRDFPVDFDYLAREFVVVTLLGNDRRELIQNSEYTFQTSTSIRTTETWGPTNGGYDNIEVRRVTSATERLVTFNDASILRASDLNLAELQTVHIAQEARDLVSDSLGVDDDGNLDARNRRIVNLGNPIDPQDAMTKEYYDSRVGETKDARDAAIAARDKAQQWATQLATPVEGADLSAKQYALNAKASENAAEADRATVAADKATVAADKATVAADKAIVAADKATVAADKATVAADKATVATDRASVESTAANVLQIEQNAQDAIDIANTFDTRLTAAETDADNAVTTANAAAAAAAGKMSADGSVPMSGSLRINTNNVENATVTLDADPGVYKGLLFRTDDKNRWTVYTNSEAETGAEAGSNFVVDRYKDDGTWTATVLNISRKTGNIVSTGGLTFADAALASDGYGQTRIKYGNYGTFWRQDGVNLYLMGTNSGNQAGGWNDYRPFMFNVTNGEVKINEGGHGGGTMMGYRLRIENRFGNSGEIQLRANDGYNFHMRGRNGAGMEWVNHEYNAVVAFMLNNGEFYFGTQGARLAVDGNVYMPMRGQWLNDALNSKVGVANCQWNSFVEERGPISSTYDAPAPQVLMGVRGGSGSATANFIFIRSVWIRNF